MTTEESLEGFGKAMRLGVSTLELDTHITKDEKVVVNHDRQINPQKCRDTAPVTPGDPMYPYVGKYVKDLTLAEIKTMDCAGSCGGAPLSIVKDYITNQKRPD